MYGRVSVRWHTWSDLSGGSDRGGGQFKQVISSSAVTLVETACAHGLPRHMW
jgi:hypothetical protein